MYVIEVTNNTAAAIGPVPVGQTRVLPADRCTWTIQQTPTSYRIAAVMFYPGNAVADDFGVTGVTLTFGSISKTGRFVAHTLTNTLT